MLFVNDAHLEKEKPALSAYGKEVRRGVSLPSFFSGFSCFWFIILAKICSCLHCVLVKVLVCEWLRRKRDKW